MEQWDWENIEKITPKDYICVQKGDFQDVFDTFNLYRDEKLGLILEVESIVDYNEDFAGSQRPYGKHIPGVFYEAQPVILRHRIFEDVEIVLEGVVPYRFNRSFDLHKQRISKKEIATVYSLKSQPSSRTQKSEYLIEWLENFDGSNVLFSELIDEVVDITASKELCSNAPHALKMFNITKQRTSGRRCVYLELYDVAFYFGSADFDKNYKNRAFILYKKSIPDEETRRKIRDCLSFLVGSALLYLGCSCFSSDWHVNEFELFTPQTQDGSFLKIQAMHPFWLGVRSKNDLNSITTGFLLEHLYRIYDTYNLKHIFWVYWTAICTPMYSSAVHFGAIIESLQKSYLRMHSGSFSTSLIDSAEFKLIKKKLFSVLSEFSIKDEENQILKNKISALNQTPQSRLSERFFEALELTLNDDEKAAWKQRHNVAHGEHIDNDADFRLAIHNTNILKVLFHRVIMRIAGADDCVYYDYASLGFPLKRLSTGVDPYIPEQEIQQLENDDKKY